MLRKCANSANPQWKALLSATKGIILIGTPNQGSNLASTVLLLLKHVANKHLTELASGEEHLFDLNESFRNWAGSCDAKVAAYYETQKTYGAWVVTKLTANPNVLGCDPIAIDGDHTSICKPSTRKIQLYMSVTAILRSLLPNVPKSTDIALIAIPAALIAAVGTALISKDAETSKPTSSTAVATQPSGQTRVTVVDNNSGTPAIAISGGSDADDAPPLAPELLTDYQYFTTMAPDDRRPLAQKLEDGGRSHEKNDAQRKKERFAMSLQRHSAQASSLARYVRLMSDIESRFNRHIQPSIDGGASIGEVNQLVQTEVIDQAMASQLTDLPT